MTEYSLIMPFWKFAQGDYDDKPCNLYIVWRGKQALYVGISRDNIWNRWFLGSRSHMILFTPTDNTGKQTGPVIWRGCSLIGQAIADNLPASKFWMIELRRVSEPEKFSFGNHLKDTERELIRDLHPLFNTIGQPDLSEKELKLFRRLRNKNF